MALVVEMYADIALLITLMFFCRLSEALSKSFDTLVALRVLAFNHLLNAVKRETGVRKNNLC